MVLPQVQGAISNYQKELKNNYERMIEEDQSIKGETVNRDD